ncbi:proline-rich extensin-like protein EPR1 [Chelonus insularis]|uniref:proline-rich extensin-like protein EPR1 n=1 Tax=Chelonus insularis TaxID=460826 RepID=UPI00158EE295|nr:proline-rich extensin-like protein EPR1 [Chelonus insularis]XP_034935411.1 proline-rich extensin-like protein EPR1 [Chelonus insularis]XP_034935412.1 proline-rich extensin-like protein EPR1 [Chelonus insularis]
MKIVIIFSVFSVSLASLEPVGYTPPGSDSQSDRYLPPSQNSLSPTLTPESYYLPASYQSSSQNVIPNSLYLPSNHRPSTPHSSVVAMPPMQYLPSQQVPPSLRPLPRMLHHHHRTRVGQNSSPDHTSSPSPLPVNTLHHSPDRNAISSQYLPPSQRPDTFTQAIPSSSYLPSKQNQYPREIDQPSTPVVSPSNTYLTPNKFSSSLSGFSSLSQNRYTGHSNHPSLNQPAGHYYPSSGYPESFTGYNSEQSNIAKYDFEYRINDDLGNDYSHKESRSGDNTEGIYTVLLPDGRKQIVRYVANRNGYKPTITYEGSLSGQLGYQY